MFAIDIVYKELYCISYQQRLRLIKTSLRKFSNKPSYRRKITVRRHNI